MHPQVGRRKVAERFSRCFGFHTMNSQSKFARQIRKPWIYIYIFFCEAFSQSFSGCAKLFAKWFWGCKIFRKAFAQAFQISHGISQGKFGLGNFPKVKLACELCSVFHFFSPSEIFKVFPNCSEVPPAIGSSKTKLNQTTMKLKQ